MKTKFKNGRLGNLCIYLFVFRGNKVIRGEKARLKENLTHMLTIGLEF